MTNLPPPAVLAKRLEHELTTARIYAEAGRADMALARIEKAESVLAQLQGAMR